MNRRYPPDLRQNISDIVDHERRQDTGRIGPTTVREGDAGLILRDSSGNRIAQIGGSGSGFGVQVNVRGAVQNVVNALNEDASRITYLDQSKASNDALAIERGRITWLDQNKASNGDLAVERGRITWLDRNKASNASVAQVGTWATNAQNTANTANSTANTALTRANNAQTSANNAYDRGTQGVNAASTAQSRANAAYDRAGDAQSAASAVAGRIPGILVRLTRLEDRVFGS